MHDDLYDDIVISKFERYFLDPNSSKGKLEIGDHGKAVQNVWQALIILDYISPPKQSTYTNELAKAVAAFQQANQGRADGEVGERTRKILARELKGKGLSIFLRLNAIRVDDKPGVFISYSHKDSDWVKDLEKWLTHNGVNVIRDEMNFAGGEKISRAVHNSIATADRVVVVWSKNSNDSKWVTEEIFLAKQIEQRTKLSILVYVKLDNAESFPTDSEKIFIDANTLKLDEVGASIIKALDEKKIWGAYI